MQNTLFDISHKKLHFHSFILIKSYFQAISFIMYAIFFLKTTTYSLQMYHLNYKN